MTVPDSFDQIIGLMEGRYDVVMTPIDNVVAYQEGQGEIQIQGRSCLFASMVGIKGCLRLLSGPACRSIEASPGTSIGADAEHTGYTLAMYQLLEQNGLSSGSYKIVRKCGTTLRVKALNEGTIAATMVSSPLVIRPVQPSNRSSSDPETGRSNCSRCSTSPDPIGTSRQTKLREV